MQFNVFGKLSATDFSLVDELTLLAVPEN